MTPLRVALPKGRLLDRVLSLFSDCGYRVPDSEALASRRLVFVLGEVEWILVKDGDVPVYVEFGAADVGVAGLDQLLEHRSDVLQPAQLPFGECRLMLIGAPGVRDVSRLSGSKIATKYPQVTKDFLARRGVTCDIVSLHGSVELAAVLDLAPYVVDLVETGATIRVHGLHPLEVVAEVSPRLIVNRNSYRIDSRRIQQLISAVRTAVEKEQVA